MMNTGFFHKALAHLTPNVQVVLWMVAMPLLLTLAGYWEWGVYNPSEYRTASASEQANVQRLEQLLARIEGDRYAKLEINGRNYGNPLATIKLRAAIADLKGSASSDQRLAVGADWAHRLAAVVMAAGVFASLLGVAGLLIVRLAGTRALHSRNDLLRSFGRWRRHLPRYLGLLLSSVALGFTALTLVRCFALYESATVDQVSRAGMKVQLVLLVLVALTAWGGVAALWRLRGVMASLKSEPMQVLGRVLSYDDAPGLWQYVTALALRVGAPLPEHIVLGMQDSFYVTAHDMVVQPARDRLQGQILHLPLTYLTLLRRDEIDAIMAHELGHFVGEDTAYSLRFSPLYEGLTDALERVDAEDFEWGNAPAVSFCSYLLQRFDLAVKHWSRERELAADRVSAHVAGAEASARALVHITALAPVVERGVAEIARRPDEAGHDLIDLLSAAVYARPLSPPDFQTEVATAHPHDTHPPTLDRLHAMGQTASTALVNAALAPPGAGGLAWVRSLFADCGTMQAELLEDFKVSSREHNEQTRQALGRTVGRASGTVEIFDARIALWLFTSVGIFLAAMVALEAVRLLRGEGGGDSGAGWMLVGCLAGALLFFGMAWWAYKRGRQMLMAVTPDGLQVPGLPQMLSWAHVADYSATESHGNISLSFILTPDAPEFKQQHSNYRRMRYRRAKGRLDLSMFGVRGMKSENFYELLSKYLNAWQARQVLGAM